MIAPERPEPKIRVLRDPGRRVQGAQFARQNAIIKKFEMTTCVCVRNQTAHKTSRVTQNATGT